MYRFALDGENIKNARLSQLLIGINVGIFIIINLFLKEQHIDLFWQDNEKVLSGEYWRLLTSVFLHADMKHLFYNMVGLLLFGATLEQFLSKSYTLIIFLISGLIGSIFSLILNPVNTISLGASGAVFGLMGFSFIVLSRQDKRIFLYGLFYLFFAINNSFAPGIGTWAHIFGLIAGIIFGFIYIKNKSKILRLQMMRDETR